MATNTTSGSVVRQGYTTTEYITQPNANTYTVGGPNYIGAPTNTYAVGSPTTSTYAVGGPATTSSYYVGGPTTTSTYAVGGPTYVSGSNYGTGYVGGATTNYVAGGHKVVAE
jgi:hypothetical protein